MLREFSHPLLVEAVCDDVDHDLARALPGANHEVTEESGVLPKVPWRPIPFLCERAHTVDYFSAQWRLQVAFVEIENLVEMPRRVESEGEVGIEVAAGIDLLPR